MSRYVEERRDVFGVEPICRVLGVPVSTHYARRSRKPSRRDLAVLELLFEIEAARTGYRREYGARKTWKEFLPDARERTADERVRIAIRGYVDAPSRLPPPLLHWVQRSPVTATR